MAKVLRYSVAIKLGHPFEKHQVIIPVVVFFLFWDIMQVVIIHKYI
jgi:hypothetical protein